MATMNVSLPDAMKAWVESRSEDGRYANASDYVRDLIRRDQVKAEKIAAMRRHVEEGLASGFSEVSMEEVWQEAMTQLGAADEVQAKRQG